LFNTNYQTQKTGFSRQLMTSNRDAVIFVIDASSSMLRANQSDEATEIPFRSAVQCASEVMTSKLISDTTTDLIGVVFMGTV
jgi:hypothetical protein